MLGIANDQLVLRNSGFYRKVQQGQILQVQELIGHPKWSTALLFYTISSIVIVIYLTGAMSILSRIPKGTVTEAPVDYAETVREKLATYLCLRG
ncbi:hypothetical protein R1sor_008430 [Riccia sorocarpa]|uniref:Uncharacterized protein n=1 Tax=Riccia sorocarpa TaxID=122646 RepID=A0ABD3HVJ6_9MARC